MLKKYCPKPKVKFKSSESQLKRMVISDSEIDLNNWVNFRMNQKQADFNVFQDKILELNLRNSLFVDTASEVIPSTYSKYLKNGVGIITYKLQIQ